MEVNKNASLQFYNSQAVEGDEEDFEQENDSFLIADHKKSALYRNVLSVEIADGSEQQPEIVKQLQQVEQSFMHYEMNLSESLESYVYISDESDNEDGEWSSISISNASFESNKKR